MLRLKRYFLYACRAAGLFRLARHLNRNKLLILCYHGFAYDDEADFRPKLYICPTTFERRMRILARENYRVVDLDDAIGNLYQEQLDRHSVVITIDDGFASVYDLAWPVLKALGYPATTYVTSYYVAKSHPIFRLAVQYTFWKTTLARVDLAGVEWTDRLLVDLRNTDELEESMWRCIRFGEESGNEHTRALLLQDLCDRLHVDYEDIVRKRIVSLMTSMEIANLDADGMNIQLHTHRHIFPPDDPERCTREIHDNRSFLEKTVSRPLVHFCYPSGVWEPSQWDCLTQAGVVSATTCNPGFNDARTPRLALNRFLDSERISDIEFRAEVSGFADLMRGIKSSLLRGVEATSAPTKAKQS